MIARWFLLFTLFTSSLSLVLIIGDRVYSCFAFSRSGSTALDRVWRLCRSGRPALDNTRVSRGYEEIISVCAWWHLDALNPAEACWTRGDEEEEHDGSVSR